MDRNKLTFAFPTYLEQNNNKAQRNKHLMEINTITDLNKYMQ